MGKVANLSTRGFNPLQTHLQMRKVGFRGVILFLLIFSLFGCVRNRVPQAVSFVGLGTFIEIEVYDQDFVDKHKIFRECELRVKEIEKWGNIFEPKSEISKLNSEAQKKWVKVSPDFFSVLKVALAGSQKTEGAFDVSVKTLMDYYQIKSKVQGARYKVLGKVGYRNVLLRSSDSSVRLKNGVEIDLSGVLKGYVVDEIVGILKLNGVKKALVNAGGTIYGLGTDDKDRPWVIGIRDPENRSKVIKRIEIVNKAVSTSAGYEKNIKKNGKKFSHIVDPRSGKLVEAKGSVTVVSDKAIWADIYSTAAFVDHKLANNIKSIDVYLY